MAILFRNVVATNYVTVTGGTSGTPATFADFVTFDRAGGTARTITGASKANPCVITSVAHGLTNGDYVLIANVVGMTELNGRIFVVAGVTTDTFQLSGIDSSAYTTYTSGGTATDKCYLQGYSAPSATLTLAYPVRPVELRALLISFVIQNKTTETDYLYITGTDWNNAAQTESIDVSAGNGIYTTTKYFRTITNIDCSDNSGGGGTVWADGTVAVYQPIWGLIWENLVGYSYTLDTKMIIGDGTTSTYFNELNKQIIFTNKGTALRYESCFTVKNNANLRFGEVVDAALKTTRYGCDLINLFTYPPNYNPATIAEAYGCTGTCELYSCSFDQLNSWIRSDFAAGNFKMWNCLFRRRGAILDQFGGGGDYYNILLTNMGYGFGGKGTMDRIACLGGVTGLVITRYDAKTFTNPLIKGCTTAIANYAEYSNNIVINGEISETDWSTKITYVAESSYLYRRYTIDIHLTDTSGNNISGASVTLKDKDGNTLSGFPVTTGADGKITQQYADYKRYKKTGGAIVVDTFSPHTLTITKAGYQDYQEVVTIDRKMDLEVALSTPIGGVSPTNLGLVPLGIKQVAI